MQNEHTFISYQTAHFEEVGELKTWLLIPETGLFSQQVQLVQTSFTKLLTKADQTAKIFYSRLFELSPSFQPMFRSDMVIQRQKLMSTLQVAVNGLSDLKQILSAVEDLGRRHAGYGVKPEYYETVGQALIYALQQQLGAEFTPKVKAAWIEAYSLLSNIMKTAAAEVPVKVPETVERE